MSTIQFEHVSKHFGGNARAAVDDCTFDVASGAFVVLLGPSGCGKTTLLKMVNRLYEPTGGTIRIDGVATNALDATTLRRRIGYVIQQNGLFPHMTVAQNIAVVPQLLGWQRPRITARIDELLMLVDLDPAEYRRRYPAQLSGGQQQRVGLARALASDPPLLLMDEPFGAIDALTRTSLQGEMQRLQRKLHKTILFVTHDVDEALRLADQIVVMQRGNVVQYDTPLGILAHPANSFVRELVGADDIVRQLSLVPVGAAMQILPTQPLVDAPIIAPDANLRQALNMLLQPGVTQIVVADANGAQGVLTLAAIHAAIDTRVGA